MARMGRGEVHTGFWWGDLRKDVDGRIILKYMLNKWDEGRGLNLSGVG